MAKFKKLRQKKGNDLLDLFGYLDLYLNVLSFRGHTYSHKAIACKLRCKLKLNLVLGLHFTNLTCIRCRFVEIANEMYDSRIVFKLNFQKVLS